MGSFWEWDPARLARWKKELEEMFPNLPSYTVRIDTHASDSYLQWEELRVSLETKPAPIETIARFSLSGFPETNLLISTKMFVGTKFVRRGIATELMWFKKRVAKEIQKAGIVATVSNHNLAEIGLLKKTRWKKLQEFGDFAIWSTFPD